MANQRYLKDHVNNGIYYVAGNGDDSVVATSKSDILNGGAGNDTFDGKGGDDYLEGGAGTDTYTVNAGGGRFNCVLSSNLAPPRSLKFQI